LREGGFFLGQQSFKDEFSIPLKITDPLPQDERVGFDLVPLITSKFLKFLAPNASWYITRRGLATDARLCTVIP